MFCLEIWSIIVIIDTHSVFMMSKILVPSLRINNRHQLFDCCIFVSKSDKIRFLSTTQPINAKDYYAVLGIPRAASAKDIKAAYYDKAKIYHPDANSSEETVSRFQEVSEAYEILGDEQKRRVYDLTARSPQFAQRDVYGHETTSKRNGPYRFRKAPIEPISMKHINHVYKTLNKVENEETPICAPFVDHCYPGTHYNRFEFSRIWDVDHQRWAYVKKPTADSYNRKMQQSQSNQMFFVSILIISVLAISMFRANPKLSESLKTGLRREDKFAYTRVRRDSDLEKEALIFNQTNKFDE